MENRLPRLAVELRRIHQAKADLALGSLRESPVRFGPLQKCLRLHGEKAGSPIFPHTLHQPGVLLQLLLQSLAIRQNQLREPVHGSVIILQDTYNFHGKVAGEAHAVDLAKQALLLFSGSQWQKR